LISPKDFLEHSNTLLDQGEKNEILLRNIARNSYYALYHKLKEIHGLPSPEKNKREFGSHETFIQQLRKCEDEDYNEWGVIPSKLKSTRTHADYKLDIKFSDYDARNALAIVKKTFLRIDSKSSEKTHEAVTHEAVTHEAVTHEAVTHEAETDKKKDDKPANQITPKPRARATLKLV
jgi:hypothetical protein